MTDAAIPRARPRRVVARPRLPARHRLREATGDGHDHGAGADRAGGDGAGRPARRRAVRHSRRARFAHAPGAGGPGTTATRPSPAEFVAVLELEDLHFDFDKYDIRPGDARALNANARWMKANPGYLVLIEGHADERGTNEYNLVLGERRAKAAMNYLVAQGVQAPRFTLVSYGEERPLCREKTEVCWARNRRAHFLVKRQ